MAMRASEYRDDDEGYLKWLVNYPDGYVINILRTHNPSGARLHHADCRTVNGQSPNVAAWTRDYVKVCAQSLEELDRWSVENSGELIARCGSCRPPSAPGNSSPVERAAAVTEEQFVIHGPTASRPTVEAWADNYIHFERRPPWQDRLRNEVRRRCQQLAPSAHQVLHASFLGPKLSNADVENLVIYNVGSFKEAGVNGIRFELGGAASENPDGAEHRFGYRYALARRSGSFTNWEIGRQLASFGWTDLGRFTGGNKLAQVWWAITRASVHTSERIDPETSFAVRVELRPPHGRKPPVWGNLVKSVFDGVICALQAHSGPVAPEVGRRLAKQLQVPLKEVEELLTEPRWDILGEVKGLVSPYRSGVKWNPSDHLCVAGELLAVESKPGEANWSIKGEVFEVSRRPT